MVLAVQDGINLVRAWLTGRADIPKGVGVFSGTYDREHCEREYRVGLTVDFSVNPVRKQFRLLTLRVTDEGEISIIRDRVDYVFNGLLRDAVYTIVVDQGIVGNAARASNPYDRNNPPQSVDAAHARLGDLVSKKARIQARLQTDGPENYNSLRDFHDWKNRATAALGHAETEYTFVSNWIRSAMGGDGQPRLTPLVPFSPEAADALAAEVDAEVVRVRQLYSAVYSSQNLPHDYQAAVRRKSVLRSISAALNTFDTEFMRRTTAAGVSRGRQKIFRRSLLVLHSEVRAELEIIYVYLQQSIANPIETLLNVIDRVVAEGHLLSEDEQEQVAAIRTLLK